MQFNINGQNWQLGHTKGNPDNKISGFLWRSPLADPKDQKDHEAFELKITDGTVLADGNYPSISKADYDKIPDVNHRLRVMLDMIFPRFMKAQLK